MFYHPQVLFSFTLQIQIFLRQTYLLVILSSFHGGDLCDGYVVVAVTLISRFSPFLHGTKFSKQFEEMTFVG